MPSKFYGRTGLVDAVTCLSVLPVAAASKFEDAGTMKTPFRSDGRSFIDIFSCRTRLPPSGHRAGDEACARLPLEFTLVGFSSSRSSPLPSPRHPLGVETAADGIEAGASDHFDPRIESGVFSCSTKSESFCRLLGAALGNRKSEARVGWHASGMSCRMTPFRSGDGRIATAALVTDSHLAQLPPTRKRVTRRHGCDSTRTSHCHTLSGFTHSLAH